MCVFSIWSSASSPIAALMSSNNVKTGTSTASCVYVYAHTCYFLVPISVWLWWDSQSSIYKSGPGFTGGCAAWCIVATVTGLQCLCQPLLLIVCGLELFILPLWNCSDGIFPIHAVCQGFPIHVAITSLYTGQHFACKCNGHNAVLSGTLSCPQVMPSITCKKLAQDQ